MGGDGGGDQTTEIRYAPYVELQHENFLITSNEAGETARLVSPYADYTALEVDDAFFGAGFTISSFPSLYDMYGKFMAGLDVENLWEQVLDGTHNNAIVGGIVTAESDLLDDELSETVLPRFQLGLRDVNAVMSSSFVVGKSLIESAKVKSVAKFDAEIRYKLIPIAAERWLRHLNWNREVISSYLQVMQSYYSTALAVDETNISMVVKSKLWPFTVLDYERANLGALTGATNATGVAGESPSTAQKAIGGALGGAAAGAAVGGPTGAVIGGVLGLASGFF